MKGCYTAIVTPFKDDKVDYDSLAQVLDLQVQGGMDGVVPCGTTGESCTLSHEEHDAVIEFVLREAKGKLKVIAGAGSNATQESLRLARNADQGGADGLLLVSPYYNKPTQEGLYQHYKKIAESVSCELVLYNIPGRTSVNIDIDTFHRLAADCPNFTTVKEATGSIDFASQLKNTVPRLDIVSGNDSLNLPMASIGGVGCISVLSNILPKSVKEVFTLHTQGKAADATKLHHRLLSLIEALFGETNPIPIKYACQQRGIISTADLRLPLTTIGAAARTQLETALAAVADLH